MKLLLDTHTIIWALTGDKRLPKKVIDMILDENNIIYFSDVSLWEIAIKNFKNPDLCPYNEKDIFEKCIASDYLELPIKKEHIFEIRNLKTRKDHELVNLDPFDRILLSQAKNEECLFLTADSNMDNYEESSIYKI